jgi:hypothetical protein
LTILCGLLLALFVFIFAFFISRLRILDGRNVDSGRGRRFRVVGGFLAIRLLTIIKMMIFVVITVRLLFNAF